MRILTAIAALCLGLAGAAPAVAQTPEEQRQIDWVGQRGRLLFELDRAAWVATDDMLARVHEPAAQGIRGYIVEQDGVAFVVTFYGGTADAPVAVYRGRVENRRVRSREAFAADARPALGPGGRRLAAVRDRASGLGRRPCGEAPFNTIVVPPATTDGPIDLYLLTPQVHEGEYPFGGHYRFTFAADGTVQSSREFTRSCIAFSTADAPRGRPAAMMITHLLDQVPTEIHVFTSLAAGLPVYVATSEPRRAWSVEGDRVRLIDINH